MFESQDLLDETHLHLAKQLENEGESLLLKQSSKGIAICIIVRSCISLCQMIRCHLRLAHFRAWVTLNSFA